MTQITIDGVMQGNEGTTEEDRKKGNGASSGGAPPVLGPKQPVASSQPLPRQSVTMKPVPSALQVS
jgi:hypothetical protein